MKCLDNKENIDNEIGLKPLKLRKLLPYKYYKILYILVGKYVIIRICPQLYFFDTLFSQQRKETVSLCEYYGAAEPLVRCGESHLSGLTEPLRSLV